jgi:hypothetical protein
MAETNTTKDASFSPKDLIVALPLFVSALALTFDVGYFQALDIDYLSSFSLTEHIVLSMQALPLASTLAMASVAYFVMGERSVRGWFGADGDVRLKIGYALFAVLGVVGLGAAYVGLWAVSLGCISAAMTVLVGGMASRPAEVVGFMLIPVAMGISWGAGYDMASDRRFRPARTHVLKTDTGDVEGTLLATGERGILFQFANTKEIGVVRRDGIKQISIHQRLRRCVETD